MRTKPWRMIGASVSLGLLVVFFLPTIYHANMFPCMPGGACLADRSGLQSIGYAALHWGAYYSELGYGLDVFGGFDGANAVFIFLLFFAFPTSVVCAGLIAPEIARISRTARSLLVAFGGFTVLWSALVLAETRPRPSPAEIIFLPLAWIGGLMVMYGMQRWIFSPNWSPRRPSP
jgi:hypothetical protein